MLQVALGVRQELAAERRNQHAYTESRRHGQPPYFVGPHERGEEVSVRRIVDVRESGDTPLPEVRCICLAESVVAGGTLFPFERDGVAN